MQCLVTLGARGPRLCLRAVGWPLKTPEMPCPMSVDPKVGLTRFYFCVGKCHSCYNTYIIYTPRVCIHCYIYPLHRHTQKSPQHTTEQARAGIGGRARGHFAGAGRGGYVGLCVNIYSCVCIYSVDRKYNRWTPRVINPSSNTHSISNTNTQGKEPQYF